MTDTPSSDTPGNDTPGNDVPPATDRREPDGSLQRRLVESVQAYEVDPPAPERTHPDRPEGPGPAAEG